MLKPTKAFKRTIEKIARTHGIDLATCPIGTSIRLKNAPYQDLTIEIVYGESNGRHIAIHHTYVQNGDLIFDPEIVIYVAPTGDWYPYQFENYRGIRRYVDFKNGRPYKYNPRMQNDLVSFCTKWGKNIARQGFHDATATITE